MKKKTVLCKTCNNEIAKSAKVCPHCGAKQKNGKKIGLILIGIAVFLMLIDGLASISSSEPDKIYKIGEVIPEGKYELTVDKVTKRNFVGTYLFEEYPQDGAVFVTVDYKYKNVSKEPLSAFDTPTLTLVSPDDVKYYSDSMACGSYATQVNLDEKFLSDLNPNLTAKAATVFEVSKEEIAREGWLIDVNGKKVEVKF